MADTSQAAVSGKKKVLIIDDHPLTRMGVVQIVETQHDLIVCGQSGHPREALLLIESTQPDLVITDLSLPGKGGLELIKDLHALYPKMPVLVVSMHAEPHYSERVLLAGARGYLVKNESASHLVPAIQQVLRGKVYLCEDMAAHIMSNFAARPQQGEQSITERLTDREIGIFELVGRARSSRQIAAELGVSVKTVNAHLANMKQKLNVGSLRELARLAGSWVDSQGVGGNGD